MSDSGLEDDVRRCYAGWSTGYYDSYYGDAAAYPPVHRDLLKQLLREARVRRLLDAGCGPASFLRELTDEPIELAGFDLTPEMVAEARRVLGDRGEIWEGSVLDPEPFAHGAPYDAAICVGVLPHVPADADVTVIRHLRSAVADGGLVVLEARNQLFSLFTFNRYSQRFLLEELVREPELRALAAEQLAAHFRLDLPPERDYDQVLSRTHNPLVLRSQLEHAGFRDVRTLFYHYHAAPPLLEPLAPELFRRESMRMEDPDDWRGIVMASAFLLAGRRA